MGIPCPYPYPGEMLNGTLARISRRAGLPISEIERLSGYHVRFRHDGAFCMELLAFFDDKFEGRRSIWELACSNTIFPMVMPFAAEKTIKQYKSLTRQSIRPDGRFYNIGWRKLRLKSHLCFCRECFREQLDRYSENYWKLIWQIPLADMCEIHGTPLTQTSLPGRHSTRVFDPTDIDNSACRELEVTEHSRMLTKTIAALLANRRIAGRDRWRDIISRLAKNAGISDVKAYRRNNGVFITSPTLADQCITFWGENWLAQNFSQILSSSTIQLGNYWLKYLILIKALDKDPSLSFDRYISQITSKC
jgi:hypothetical protein